MNRALLTLLVTAMIAGCSPLSEVAPSDSAVALESSAQSVSVAWQPETEKFYDFFTTQSYVHFLLSNETPQEFDSAQMSAFILSHLIAADVAGYDFAVGYPAPLFQETAQKFFGRPVEKLENKMTTIIAQTGNITSTGWGDGTVRMVLKSLETDKAALTTQNFICLHLAWATQCPQNLL